ncbi:phage holin family protein [Paramixta manurensis]|uniref:Phage holin family protein n=1 Tax=Paramixta manurensis TaxID=2740817 RepID=A0A6M8UDV1_9GAMM|nr:phage holin family protein [Erwiniaceae bacterium PD-1]
MIISNPLVFINVVISSAIVLRLMLYRKPTGKHNRQAAWLAWCLIVAYGSVPFRFAFHCDLQTHWSTLTVNLILCVAIFRNRGNVARLFCS